MNPYILEPREIPLYDQSKYKQQSCYRSRRKTIRPPDRSPTTLKIYDELKRTELKRTELKTEDKHKT